MKTALIVTTVALLGAGGWWLASRDQADESQTTHTTDQSPRPTSTTTDHTEVFQKAFWKRPTANDKILHAERREWADAAGVQKWQWFIAVEPSPELVKYLREENAFMLSPSSTVPAVDRAPDWFRYDPQDVDVLMTSRGGLRLFFSKSKSLLLGTDAGGGFQPGAPEPITVTAPAPNPPTNSGRLPATPPPEPTTP
jgi:hypothetical protein